MAGAAKVAPTHRKTVPCGRPVRSADDRLAGRDNRQRGILGVGKKYKVAAQKERKSRYRQRECWPSERQEEWMETVRVQQTAQKEEGTREAVQKADMGWWGLARVARAVVSRCRGNSTSPKK